eukprot:COSAG02_NODE_11190_length_1773_cov_23.835125_3_plen_94_part_00
MCRCGQLAAMGTATVVAKVGGGRVAAAAVALNADGGGALSDHTDGGATSTRRRSKDIQRILSIFKTGSSRGDGGASYMLSSPSPRQRVAFSPD